MKKKNRRFLLVLTSVVGVASILSQPVVAEQARKTQEMDNRTLLTIPYEDREDLLRVMRKNLTSLGEMIDAMAEDDFKTVEKVADKMSFNEKKGQGLARRGNPGFTAMGVQFHAVDAIAIKKAAETKNRNGTLRAMSRMVSSCVACHESFKVIEWPNNKIYKRPAPSPLVLPPGVTIRD